MAQGSELQCNFAFLFIPPLSPSKRAFPRPSHQRAHHFPEKGEAVSSGSRELESLSGLRRGSWQSHEEPRGPPGAEDGSDRRLSQCQGPLASLPTVPKHKHSCASGRMLPFPTHSTEGRDGPNGEAGNRCRSICPTQTHTSTTCVKTTLRNYFILE